MKQNSNFQPTSSKEISKTQLTNLKPYDLEERTLEFGKRIVKMCKILQKDTANIELIKQCLRSGTSIGANYIEANDALSKKDFVHRMRISRKEAKETIYWLKLLIEANSDLKDRMNPLITEADELKRILSSIIDKSQITLK